jgi:hypothetical protein
MGFAAKLKSLLTGLLYKLGIWKESGDSAQPSPRPEAHDIPAGTHGRLEADAVILSEDNRIVLSVGHDFEDVPSWVEWDMKTGRLSVAQMGGALAELKLQLPLFYKERMKNVKRLALVTGSGPEKMMHYIAFIMREA